MVEPWFPEEVDANMITLILGFLGEYPMLYPGLLVYVNVGSGKNIKFEKAKVLMLEDAPDTPTLVRPKTKRPSQMTRAEFRTRCWLKATKYRHLLRQHTVLLQRVKEVQVKFLPHLHVMGWYQFYDPALSFRADHLSPNQVIAMKAERSTLVPHYYDGWDDRHHQWVEDFMDMVNSYKQALRHSTRLSSRAPPLQGAMAFPFDFRHFPKPTFQREPIWASSPVLRNLPSH
jgi:hypothetical protein